MFVAVSFEDRAESGFFRRMGDRLYNRDITARRASFGGSAYWHVVQNLYGDKPDWELLARVCGPQGQKLLLPKGMSPPKGLGLRLCPLEVYSARMTVRLTCQLLEELGAAARTAAVGVLDMEGGCSGCCEILAERCGTVKAYTGRPEKYAARAEKLMEERGAALVVCDSPEELSDCLICAAPSPAGVVRLRCPVVTVEKSLVQGRPTINRPELQLPEAYAAAVPQGIAPEDFFGALELYGSRRPDMALSAAAVRIDGRRVEAGEIMLELSAGKHYY